MGHDKCVGLYIRPGSESVRVVVAVAMGIFSWQKCESDAYWGPGVSFEVVKCLAEKAQLPNLQGAFCYSESGE